MKKQGIGNGAMTLVAALVVAMTVPVQSVFAEDKPERGTRKQIIKTPGKQANGSSLKVTGTKITSSDAMEGDFLGGSVDISGDTMVVGAYLDDDAGTSSGAAYVYRWDGMTWNEEAKLTASDAARADLFGKAVAIDGDTIVVGSFMDDDMGSHSGSAYVFRRTGNVWSQEAKLIDSDGVEGDILGFSVAISGDTVVVGAPAIGEPVARFGAVYIFRWNGTGWNAEARLTGPDGQPGDGFGYAVDISGDAVIAGALLDGEGGPESGAAYAFRRNGVNWSLEAKLAASDSNRDDLFGCSVSISGDTAVVGAYRTGRGNRGAAYVFEWNGNDWSQEAKLTASDDGAHDFFGQSVSISGERIVAGAPRANGTGKANGAAYVFHRMGTTWSEEAILTASDAATDDFFGGSVSFSENTIAVGAPRNDSGGINAGSGYVFTD